MTMTITTHRLALLALAGVLAACTSTADADGDGGGDLAAMCSQMEGIEGPEDISVEVLDDLLEVAVDDVREPIQLIRDRLAADGEAAYEDPEVGAAFEQVGTFEGMECSEG